MKKKFSLLIALVALSAFTFMGCANVFDAAEDADTAVSGKVYTGMHSGVIYSLSFSKSKKSVVVTEGSSSTAGSYELSGSSLTVITNTGKINMTYDTDNDCIYYEHSTLS